jgi:4-amino-4-deoxy-L-arabinose transferase-like glycosyltransferase
MPSGSAASATSEARPPGAAGLPGIAWAALAALALALVLDLAHLGARSLHDDEAIYANPARQAAVHGDWYPLRVRGAIYRSKPPLAVWPVALSFRLLGVNEAADRLPSALEGAALAALTAGFAAWLLGPWTGLLAGGLLATCRPWLLRHGAREGVGDPLLCLLLASTLLLHLRYRSTGRRRWLLAAAGAAALAGLVKDFVGPLFALAILGVWEVACARAERVPMAPRLRAPLAVAGLGLLPYLAWFADTLRRDPRFAAYQVRNLVLRHTHGLASVHVHGPGYYPAVLGEAFGHWWPALLPAALAWFAVRQGGAARARAFLLLPVWAGVVIAILLLSASSLWWYLDPAYPPLAVLLAAGGAEVARRLGRWPAARLGFAAVVAGLLAARIVTAWQNVVLPYPPSPMQRFVLAFRRLPPDARLYIGPLEPPGTLVREWNHFYLDELAAAARPLPPILPPARCNVVAIAAPLARRPDLAGARILPVATTSDGEAPVVILDLCGGSLARLLPQG